MYQFLKTLGARKFLLAELPVLLLAFLIAETVYKFGSFMLECGAFLLTWLAISWLFHFVQPPKKYE
jgi:hypothetical protein